MERLIIEALCLSVGKFGQGDGSQVAHCNLIFARVLENLSAEIAALDRAKVLLVALSIAGVFEKQVRSSCLNLCVNNLIPKPLSLNGFSALARLFVSGIQLLKLFSPRVEKSRAFIWAHQGPVSVSFNSFHEKIGDPQGIEQITSTVFFSPVVFPQLQEFNDVSVPWLQVYRKRTFSLASALVNIPSCVIKHFQHRHQPVAVAICSADVAVTSADVVDGKANTTSVLTDNCTLLKCVVNPIDAVLSHGKQKAA